MFLTYLTGVILGLLRHILGSVSPVCPRRVVAERGLMKLVLTCSKWFTLRRVFDPIMTSHIMHRNTSCHHIVMHRPSPIDLTESVHWSIRVFQFLKSRATVRCRQAQAGDDESSTCPGDRIVRKSIRIRIRTQPSLESAARNSPV